jgi:hypothetical protein|tara:strand:+ start:14 stop:805 length:792 start_codon:yes stop_codon:yes gene_type:complete
MTVDATDNPEMGIPDEDNPDDGIGASADEVVEEEPDYSADPLAYIEKLEDFPDEVREAIKGGFLRQSDYTKKTQSLAADRARLDDRRSVVDQILLAQKGAAEAPAEKKEAPPPDMKKGASPEDVINYYVDRAVKAKLEALGVSETVNEIQPLAAQQRVVSAYRNWAKENPGLNHGDLAGEVGRVLDSDPDLVELASVDPDRAVRLAAKIAQTTASAAKTTAKSKKRRAAAPVSTRNGSAVTKKKRETPLEAATRALREQGVNI